MSTGKLFLLSALFLVVLVSKAQTQANTACNDASLNLPNAFSPNEDGNNDLFCLEGWAGCVSAIDIKIYNRVGEEIYKSTDVNQCWDGKFKDVLVQEGVYLYTLKATLASGNLISRKGNLTVLK